MLKVCAHRRRTDSEDCHDLRIGGTHAKRSGTSGWLGHPEVGHENHVTVPSNLATERHRALQAAGIGGIRTYATRCRYGWTPSAGNTSFGRDVRRANSAIAKTSGSRLRDRAHRRVQRLGRRRIAMVLGHRATRSPDAFWRTPGAWASVPGRAPIAAAASDAIFGVPHRRRHDGRRAVVAASAAAKVSRMSTRCTQVVRRAAEGCASLYAGSPSAVPP